MHAAESRFLRRTVCIAFLALSLTQAAWSCASVDSLNDALRQLGNTLAVKDVIEVSVFASEDGQVKWDVWYISDKIEEELNRQKFPAADDVRVRLLNWYQSVTDRLIALTNQAAAQFKELERFNPLTDHEVVFTAGTIDPRLGGRFGDQLCSFRGPRVVHLWHPPEGMSNEPEPPKGFTVPGVELTVEVLPTKRVFQRHETIAGELKFTNTGEKDISVHPYYLRSPVIRDTKGNDAERFPSRTFTCGGTMGPPPNVVLKPGDVRRANFEVVTEPLTSFGGVNLDHGNHYVVGFEDLMRRLNIPTKVKSAPIEIWDANGQIHPRIINFASDGTRVFVVRESGEFESYAIESGGRIAVRNLPDFMLPAMDMRCGRFLNDVKYFGLVRIARENTYPNPTFLDLIQLGAGDLPLQSILLTSETDGYERAYGIDRYDNDTGQLIIFGREVELQIDCEKGAVVSRKPAPAPEAQVHGFLSPDGGYEVRFDKTIEIIDRRNPGRRVSVPNTTAYPVDDRLCGRRGVYALHTGAQLAEFVSYDGSVRKTIATALNAVMAESADGSMVAFGPSRWSMERRQPAKLEVWDVNNAQKLFELDNKLDRSPVFLSNPARLLCAQSVFIERFTACWFKDSFELYDLPSGKLLGTVNLQYSRQSLE